MNTQSVENLINNIKSDIKSLNVMGTHALNRGDYFGVKVFAQQTLVALDSLREWEKTLDNSEIIVIVDDEKEGVA